MNMSGVIVHTPAMAYKLQQTYLNGLEKGKYFGYNHKELEDCLRMYGDSSAFLHQ